ncbi:Protein of unknown function [Desulfonatronum zhilinae]|nr:Protein of unknown function [Desulfonatronum zhilinae]
MRIAQVIPQSDYTLNIVSEDGRVGWFDVRPYLEFEAFQPLRDLDEFMNIQNGKYYVEWNCGADLSVDSIEAHWVIR